MPKLQHRTKHLPASMSVRDYRQILNVAAELLAPDSLELFIEVLVNGLHRLMGAAITGYNEADLVAKRFAFRIHPRELVTDAIIEAWVKHAAENPVLRHAIAHPDDLGIYKITDFATIQKFRQTTLCRKVYAIMGAEYQMVMPIIFEKTCSVVIVFNRAIDFTELDRQKLLAVQPIVRGAYLHFRRLEAHAAALLQSEAPLVAEDSPMTARQRQVLGLIVKGKSNSEIAKELRLSIRTVEKYLEAIFRRLGVRSRSAAIAKTLRISSD